MSLNIVAKLLLLLLWICSFHFVICVMTGPLPLWGQIPHRVLSSASSFSLQYPLISLRSSSSAYVFFLIPSRLSFCLSFSNRFWKAVPMQDVINPVNPSFYTQKSASANLEAIHLRVRFFVVSLSWSGQCQVIISEASGWAMPTSFHIITNYFPTVLPFMTF